jgi:DNA-binding transcriptional MerR regulator
MPQPLLTIGELSKRTGVAPSALRYYEELGLIPRALRASGQRRYEISAVRLVGMILRRLSIQPCRPYGNTPIADYEHTT